MVSYHHDRLDSPRAGRAVVLEALADFSPEVTKTAELLTSELVTNALRHAGPSCALTVETTATSVTVTVEDDNDDVDLEPLDVAPESETGRGLAIVQAFAHAWGVVTRPCGKAVWFTLVAPDDRARQ